MFTTYVLVIEKTGWPLVRMRKESICMEKGLYLYVGSAKKGLEQRLARHMKKRKNRFWHIDYITSRRDQPYKPYTFPRSRNVRPSALSAN